MINANLIGQNVSSSSAIAFSLFEKSSFGVKDSGKITYSLSEVLYLVEGKKMEVSVGLKKLRYEDLVKKFIRYDKKIQLKYAVFRNLRKKGYLVKTALKFGADFRVYDKGKKMGKVHAKWIVFVSSESERTSWNEFSAKNRVAHSTKKKLLLAIVDDERDVLYYETTWIKI
ncbi:tRNA-intron lyase [Candidatus Pacearchaeota archaeon]|nr:tRNA-intron lyase [Candidatus Pacearchaeota archaeon]